jgi:hypothetical protein
MIAETRGNPLALLERHHRFGEGEYEYSEIVIQLLLRAAGAERVGRDLVSVDARGIEARADWDDLGSGETYLGYAGATNFASPGGASRDRPQEYALPDSLHLNRWAIAGDWTIRRQAAVLNAAQGRIAHRFSFGVVKVNLDTDAQYAFTRAIALMSLITVRGFVRSTGGLGRSTASTPGHGVRRLRRRWPLGSARRAISSDRPAEHF